MRSVEGHLRATESLLLNLLLGLLNFPLVLFNFLLDLRLTLGRIPDGGFAPLDVLGPGD